MGDKWLTTTVAAKKIGRSQETIRRYCERGWIPASQVRAGTSWRIRASDLARFIETNPTESTSGTTTAAAAIT